MKEFENVIGYDEVKTELIRLCDIMRHPEKYQKLGVNTPRGLLLHGAPGIGKTLMANCFIKASGRKAFICRKDKPNGDFVNEIRHAFSEAKDNAPSIVLLDDMDKFANEDEHHRNAEEYVTVQSCIDDVKGCEVFVLATVNNRRCLPSSLQREGRFDQTIFMCAPRGEEAEKIIQHYLDQKQYVAGINAKEIAQLLDGRSCAVLETAINEAGIYAGYAGKTAIDNDDIIKACLRLIYGAPESNDHSADAYLKETAYHEAGHAVVAEVLQPGSVNLISVSAHCGNIEGAVSHNLYDDSYRSREKLENRVRCALAGKAATEMVFGIVDTGASSDIHKAFDIVEYLADDVSCYGFDKFERHNSSSHLLERKEDQIHIELQRYYLETKRILSENRPLLDALAKAVMEKQYLLRKDIQAIKESLKVYR